MNQLNKTKNYLSDALKMLDDIDNEWKKLRATTTKLQIFAEYASLSQQERDDLSVMSGRAERLLTPFMKGWEDLFEEWLLSQDYYYSEYTDDLFSPEPMLTTIEAEWRVLHNEFLTLVEEGKLC